MKVDRKVQDVLAVMLELQDLWHFEDDASAWPSTGDPVAVDTGTSDPTGRVAASRRTGTRDHIARQIDRLHTLAMQIRDREMPKATGQPCATPHCEGHATHGRHCERCDRWMQRPANRGFGEPDEKLVKQWNSQRYRDCECPGWCCPEGCLDRVPPGKQRRQSDRCRKRMERARDQDREAS